MDQYSTAVDHEAAPEALAPGAYAPESISLSPFVGGVRPLSAPDRAETGDRAYEDRGSASLLASPFSTGLIDSAAPEAETAVTALLAEMGDEAFGEAVQALVDEAAGRQVTSAESWSSDRAAELPTGEVEAWMAGIAAQADQLLEHLELHFGDRTPESLSEGELEAVLNEALAAQGAPDLSGEGFLSALARRFGSVVKGVGNLARRGITAVATRLLGPLFRLVRQMVPSLLRSVLSIAFRNLPAEVQADATALAAKLGITLPSGAPAAPSAAPGEVLAELFDSQLAQAAITDNQAMADQLLNEWESAGAQDGGGAMARLDAARADLAEQLTAAAPGSDLSSELEQFIPAVMAALPLIRTGIGIYGRDKLVRLIARLLAQLIKSLTGMEATQALTRAIADKGLGLLRLEAENAAGSSQLGAEALVSTLEDTIRAVGHLPPESQEQPLRLQAEVQEAFAEAAARHMPSEILRADLDAHEMEGESAVWVLMPRGSSRRYRYRKCSMIFPAHISRQVARAIVLNDGGTLEQRFLDEGTTGWPVTAEVHLYETLPGTHLGHLAASEGEGHGAGPLETSEFEELTSQTASLLFNQPGLGRAAAGRRYYRVVIPGRPGPARKRHRRAVVRLILTGPRPVMRVHLRLSEREAHRVGELLGQRADVRLVAVFRSLILGLAQRSLPGRIIRQVRRPPGLVLSDEQARTLGGAIGERMVAAVAAQLRAMGPALAAATRDPAPGITLTFEFGFADRAALIAGSPDAPSVTIRPGWHRD